MCMMMIRNINRNLQTKTTYTEQILDDQDILELWKMEYITAAQFR